MFNDQDGLLSRLVGGLRKLIKISILSGLRLLLFILTAAAIVLKVVILIDGLSLLNVSEQICYILITGYHGHCAGLADIEAAIVASVEEVVLVKLDCIAELAAWVVLDCSLDRGQWVLIWAADGLWGFIVGKIWGGSLALHLI